MQTRTVITIGIATSLTLSLVVMGAWILISGTQGATMMDGQTMAGAMSSQMMGQGHIMGSASNRGLLGGYVGSLGSLMVLLFLGIIGLLVAAYIWERPGRPEPATCPTCGRPVETDWTACPYCGETLSLV